MLAGDGRLFISHSSKDRELAGVLVGYLEDLGIPCWIAPRDIPPGSDWAEAIMKAIEESGAMLILATDSSVSSGQVRREAEKAADRGLKIMGALIGDVDPPGWLLYHISRDCTIRFASDSIARASLRIMQLLQPSHAAGLQRANRIEHAHEDTPYPREMRRVFVCRLWMDDNTPLFLQQLVMTAGERVCGGYGGRRMNTALQGALYLFDSLSPGSTPEMVCGFMTVLRNMLREYQQDHAGFHWGLGFSAARAGSSGDLELLDDIQEAVREASRLSRHGTGLVAADREFALSCGYLTPFAEDAEGVFMPVETDDSGCGRDNLKSVRKPELALLRRRLEELRGSVENPGLGGSTHLIQGIMGEPGSGKTVLVNDLLRELEGLGDVSVLASVAEEFQWSHNRLWQGIARRLGCGNESAPPVETLVSWREGLCNLLVRESLSSPMTLIMEDIDRTDPASLKTLSEVLSCDKFSCPILFILTYREPPGGGLMAKLSAFRTSEMELGPIDAAQALELAGDTCKLSPGAVEALLNFSGGNPVFFMELSEACLHDDKLKQVDGMFRMEELPGELPPAMEAMAFAELAELSRLQRDILRAGSEAGDTFGVEDLQRILGQRLAHRSIRHELAILVNAGFLEVLEGSLEKKYRFADSRRRTAVLSTIPPRHGPS